MAAIANNEKCDANDFLFTIARNKSRFWNKDLQPKNLQNTLTKSHNLSASKNERGNATSNRIWKKKKCQVWDLLPFASSGARIAPPSPRNFPLSTHRHPTTPTYHTHQTPCCVCDKIKGRCCFLDNKVRSAVCGLCIIYICKWVNVVRACSS